MKVLLDALIAVPAPASDGEVPPPTQRTRAVDPEMDAFAGVVDALAEQPREAGSVWTRVIDSLMGRKASPVRIEIPKLARLHKVPILCPALGCGAPLLDRDLVTWKEADGWRSATYHARCSVFVMSNDGRFVRRLDGSIVPRDVTGWFDAPSEAILVTEDEWARWQASEAPNSEDFP